jgi:Zn-dependent protease
MDFDIQRILIGFAALIIHITVHEFGHAIAAVRAGDDTPKLQGRVSLNPIDHLDPFGTIMMVVTSLTGVGFGWGKPVMVNPVNFTSPRWDNLRVSFQGPLHNLILAAAFGTVMRFYHGPMSLPVALFQEYMVLTGIFLALFNLIPLGPLDGSHILSSLLPIESARKYDRFNGQYGLIIMFGLIFLGKGILGAILLVPGRLLFWLFTGQSY